MLFLYMVCFKGGKPVIALKNKYGTYHSIVDIITTRGHPKNYGWAPNFHFDNLIPYYLKLEGATNLSKINPAYHNFNGPIGNTYGFNPDILNIFLEASEELGYKNIDYMSCEDCGVARAQVQEKNGKFADISEV